MLSNSFLSFILLFTLIFLEHLIIISNELISFLHLQSYYLDFQIPYFTLHFHNLKKYYHFSLSNLILEILIPINCSYFQSNLYHIFHIHCHLWIALQMVVKAVYLLIFQEYLVYNFYFSYKFLIIHGMVCLTIHGHYSINANLLCCGLHLLCFESQSFPCLYCKLMIF